MLRITNLSINYDTLKAVNNVTITFQPGRITGIIGPNGAGKSTLIRAVVGLVDRYSGDVVFGEDDVRKKAAWVKQHCGYAPEDAELLPYLTGKEFLELIANLYRVNDIGEKVDFFLDLGGLREKESELILRYSHGMRQKLSMVAALIGDPDYIILDEALNGMDPLALYRIKKYLNDKKEEGKTILISSHIIPLVQQWCDPVVILHEGNMLKSVSKEEINQLEEQKNMTLEEYFIQLVTTDNRK